MKPNKAQQLEYAVQNYRVGKYAITRSYQDEYYGTVYVRPDFAVDMDEVRDRVQAAHADGYDCAVYPVTTEQWYDLAFCGISASDMAKRGLITKIDM